ncbi:MAG TPA: FecR domain-containing protein [Candidatus Acidoferrales bacterium]|nr:FecR domain-containing protein [Candidatus Acidoferrales bacterium]
MSLLRMKAVGSFFLATLLSAATWAVNPVSPGTLNYVEGNASVGNEAVTNKSVGEVTLAPGQNLSTSNNGKAEILLTPGVFLRLDGNSSVKMLSPDLTNTAVELDRGRAMIEVDDIHKENNLRVSEDGVQTRLLKKGLYDFDADQGQVRVDKGQAKILSGDRAVKVDSHQMVDLRKDEGKLKRQKFDPKKYEGDLYAFSRLRSQYLAQASDESSRVYVETGYGWGPGWWWDPWFGAYTYFPAGGFLYSPFGWGFYSPVAWYGGWAVPVHPVYNGHSFGPGWHAPVPAGRPAIHPTARPGFVGGFHGTSLGHGGFGGVGFHGVR